MGSPWLRCAGAGFVLALFLTSALSRGAAQAPVDESAQQASASLRVAVLRATQGEAAAAAEAIDGALLRDLAAIAGIENPTVSPIDYAEIQLTVGCSDEGRECLSKLAQMLQVEAVVVRKLAASEDGATLTLTYLDATASDEPVHAVQTSDGEHAAQALAEAVPSLVRSLFGIPEPVVAAAEAPEAEAASEPEKHPAPHAVAASSTPAPDADRANGDGARISVSTWVALAAGAGALGTGLVLGLGAQSEFDEFKAIDVQDEADARRAAAEFDSAESKGQLATVLIPAGAAVLALGLTLLVLDLNAGEDAAEIALTPLHGGAMLALRGTTEGL